MESPITIGTRTYQIDESGNLVIVPSYPYKKLLITFLFIFPLAILSTTAIRSLMLHETFLESLPPSAPISSGILLGIIFLFLSQKLQITITKEGFAIWQPKDKYPPDRITAVKVKKEIWHDYCVIIESDLEKRNVSGTLYIEQAEQVQKLIQEFLVQNVDAGK